MLSSVRSSCKPTQSLCSTVARLAANLPSLALRLRYVTRRKAGGRQSVADASKSIKSAGSSIRRRATRPDSVAPMAAPPELPELRPACCSLAHARRHNEAMLAKEVRELLMSWVPTYLKQVTAFGTAAAARDR